ncbi:HsdM family class I SAM-dependent methyltransferase [Candidatus Desulfovibrio trichonymphae]|uniref:HsdM family class I SAM-dependent methyltransferase n=1 Tax=Candidatus Desulfovibrio trichonymphae TaxID=1725232 RepID=UPI0018D515D8|nr:class I SAM-dependent DNA methyltransferase [Candidatus Desulfovibrio trichonymphae]GHU98575.1 hypothetical protein AGMMS50248_05350 [Deltaproteobacteria bacterium]
MAEQNTAEIGFEKQIWDAACILRGNLDAAEYKQVVLGLIFLKYIAERIFFVPPSGRWNIIAGKAHSPEIGTVIDDARAIEKENQRLKDILPKNFARPELDKRRLGDVVDLFTNIQMAEHGDSKDILGRAYEYCLARFAEQEGKRAGEFYTPACVVRTLVEVLKPYNGRVYDPCCGSGGMFVQSAKFVENHQGNINADTGRVTIGTARIIRDSLPNATYIGFTGTPISSKDRSTIEVFGDYIDVYDMTQAVEDGATRPVYYESRVIHLKLDAEILKLIDAEYDVMAQNAEPYAIEKSKKELGQMESILGAPQTIGALCEDIVAHYENGRQHELTDKALIVAYSRPVAVKIYHKLLELRPAWTEKVGVVMTSGNDDPEEWRPIIGNRRHRDAMAKKFKDNDDPLKIAIVVDMWLTGFDVPSLATMYVTSPCPGTISCRPSPA